MINSRDSYTDMNPNKIESYEVPFRIGTVVELKDNPDVLAIINQYRIIVVDYNRVIYVGLNSDVNQREGKVDFEITTEELEEKWKKTDKLIVGQIDGETYRIPELEKIFEKDDKEFLKSCPTKSLVKDFFKK